MYSPLSGDWKRGELQAQGETETEAGRVTRSLHGALSGCLSCSPPKHLLKLQIGISQPLGHLKDCFQGMHSRL